MLVNFKSFEHMLLNESLKLTQVAIAEMKFLVLQCTISFLGNQIYTVVTYKIGPKASKGTCTMVQLNLAI